MKNLKTISFIFLILMICKKTYSQTFRYKVWSLTETVTFNDVVNFIEDKTKIITEPSVYNKGEDIKFHDDFNATTTLTFYENTQTLKCIFIHDFIDIALINELRQSIFNQLGQPIYGYEIKITHNFKDHSYWSDYVTYDIKYEYRIPNYIISFGFGSSGVRGSKPLLNFYTCAYKINDYNTDIPTEYPSLADKDYDYVILKHEMLNKW